MSLNQNDHKENNINENGSKKNDLIQNNSKEDKINENNSKKNNLNENNSKENKLNENNSKENNLNENNPKENKLNENNISQSIKKKVSTEKANPLTNSETVLRFDDNVESLSLTSEIEKLENNKKEVAKENYNDLKIRFSDADDIYTIRNSKLEADLIKHSSYGFGRFKPRWIQYFNRGGWFLVFVSLVNFLGGSLNNGSVKVCFFNYLKDI